MSEDGFGAGVMIIAILIMAVVFRVELPLHLPSPEVEPQCRWAHWPEGRDENGRTIMKHEEICDDQPIEEIGKGS